MHNHSLIEVANMLHRVCSTIIHGECRLSESPKESPSFNLTRERWSRNLVECSTHNIISQASRRWIYASTFMMVVPIIRERFTRRGPWSMPIATILFIVGREIRFRRSSLSPFMAQLSLQEINLQLQGSSILFMRKVAPISGLTIASMGGMHTKLPILSLFKVDKMVFTLRPHRFCLVWTWTHHSWPLDSLQNQNFP